MNKTLDPTATIEVFSKIANQMKDLNNFPILDKCPICFNYYSIKNITNYEVTIICDSKHEFKLPFDQYLECLKNNNKYYCGLCHKSSKNNMYYSKKTNQILCSNCLLKENGSQENKDQEFIEIDNIGKFCDVHQGKEFQYYCKECSTHFCELCKENHEKHNFIILKDYIKSMKEETTLINLCDKEEERIKTDNEKYIKVIRDLLRTYDDNIRQRLSLLAIKKHILKTYLYNKNNYHNISNLSIIQNYEVNNQTNVITEINNNSSSSPTSQMNYSELLYKSVKGKNNFSNGNSQNINKNTDKNDSSISNLKPRAGNDNNSLTDNNSIIDSQSYNNIIDFRQNYCNESNIIDENFNDGKYSLISLHTIKDIEKVTYVIKCNDNIILFACEPKDNNTPILFLYEINLHIACRKILTLKLCHKHEIKYITRYNKSHYAFLSCSDDAVVIFNMHVEDASYKVLFSFSTRTMPSNFLYKDINFYLCYSNNHDYFLTSGKSGIYFWEKEYQNKFYSQDMFKLYKFLDEYSDMEVSCFEELDDENVVIAAHNNDGKGYLKYSYIFSLNIKNRKISENFKKKYEREKDLVISTAPSAVKKYNEQYLFIALEEEEIAIFDFKKVCVIRNFQRQDKNFFGTIIKSQIIMKDYFIFYNILTNKIDKNDNQLKLSYIEYKISSKSTDVYDDVTFNIKYIKYFSFDACLNVMDFTRVAIKNPSKNVYSYLVFIGKNGNIVYLKPNN